MGRPTLETFNLSLVEEQTDHLSGMKLYTEYFLWVLSDANKQRCKGEKFNHTSGGPIIIYIDTIWYSQTGHLIINVNED